MKSLIAIHVSLLLFWGCQSQVGGGDELASAFGNKLYESELKAVLSSATNGLDSAHITDKYVDNWVMSEILYNEAKNKVKQESNIDALVEKYKKSLYIHELEKIKLQELDTLNINSELAAALSDSTVEHVLEEPCLRFLFVKVKEAAYNDTLKAIWKTEDLPALDIYVSQVGGLALLELDKWYHASEFNNITPAALQKKINYSKTESYSLTQDGEQILLKILEYRKAGSPEPADLTIPQVKQRILHDKSVQFLKEWKKTLYQNNIQSKNIHINNN